MSDPAPRLLAGFVGGLAVGAFERFETRLLGQTPHYSAREVALRWWGDASLGLPLRLAYATVLGAVVPPPRTSTRAGAHAVKVAAGLMAFEAVVMPATGAAAPLRRWPRGQLPLLALHTLAFALAHAATHRLMDRARLRARSELPTSNGRHDG